MVGLAEQHAEVIMPGFTHLQVAQPVSFGHHLLAYVEMFSRDEERMLDVRRRVNRLPLGAAALAGTSYPLDRERVARTLGMDGVCQNSLDAVERPRLRHRVHAAAASIAMIHISRLSEELVLWMSQAFGFIDIADRFCTARRSCRRRRTPMYPSWRAARRAGWWATSWASSRLMKGQPLAYNKDNQEDKEPLFDNRRHAVRHLAHLRRDGRGITVKPEAMERAALKGYATANRTWPTIW